MAVLNHKKIPEIKFTPHKTDSARILSFPMDMFYDENTAIKAYSTF